LNRPAQFYRWFYPFFFDRFRLELGNFIAKAKVHRKASRELVLSRFPALKVKLHSPAGALSGGQQQMLAIGRALMARPDLLLLDEPSLGLAPSIVLDMFNALRQINAQGTSVLLVEQNVAVAMALASHAMWLKKGVSRPRGCQRVARMA